MKLKHVLEFVRVEHTLFSLPFVLIGFVLATRQFETDFIDLQSGNIDLLWIILAAIGARGLAMALNRIIDKDIDGKNPRTASRHLPTGKISELGAWALSFAFLITLLVSSLKLNSVAFKMAWLPVACFIVYPYTKRITWMCHFWIGLCLSLAPAGAWVAVSADSLGWASILGSTSELSRDFAWFPEIFYISLGVALWITSFDINYARMDLEIDREQGIQSFPARHGLNATRNLSILLTFAWVFFFLNSGLSEVSGSRDYSYTIWVPCVLTMGLLNLYVVTISAKKSPESAFEMERFQSLLFRVSMLTGWVLLASLLFVQDKSP